MILSAVKPLIGITTSELRRGELRTLQRHGEPPIPEMALGMTYVQAVEAAGGIPVVVPPLADRDVARMLARLDGLVLSGGPDLAPGAYGAGPHVELGVTEPRLDGFEYATAREAARLELPILGICRGAQTLNVARGGTLHQHLPDVVGDAITHRQTEDGRVPTHPVAVAPEAGWRQYSARRDWTSTHFTTRPSTALVRVCVPAHGRPTGRSRRSRTRRDPLSLAVQWHAEALREVPVHLALFEVLVRAAAGPVPLRRAA